MKHLTTCTLLIFALLTSLPAQDQFRFGVELYPNMTTTILSGEGMFAALADNRAEIEDYKFSYGIRLAAVKSMTSRIQLRLAAGFTAKRHKIHQDGEFQWPVQNEHGVFDPTIPSGEGLDAITFIYTSSYVELPTSIIYNMDASGGFYLTGGLAPLININNGQKVKTRIDGETEVDKYTDKMTDYRLLNVSVHGGIGYRLALNDRASLLIEPRAEIFPFGVVKNALIQRRYFSAGINVGILFL